MEHVEGLRRRIEARSARVGVIGLGYVGLPLAVEFARAGFRVSGVEIDPEKVEQINRGHSFIADVEEADLAAGGSRTSGRPGPWPATSPRWTSPRPSAA